MTARPIVSIAKRLLDKFGTLQWAYFGLMCCGLVLASYFLQIDKLTGGEWVAVCGLLFGTGRITDAFESKKTAG